MVCIWICSWSPHITVAGPVSLHLPAVDPAPPYTTHCPTLVGPSEWEAHTLGNTSDRMLPLKSMVAYLHFGHGRKHPGHSESMQSQRSTFISAWWLPSLDWLLAVGGYCAGRSRRRLGRKGSHCDTTCVASAPVNMMGAMVLTTRWHVTSFVAQGYKTAACGVAW